VISNTQAPAPVFSHHFKWVDYLKARTGTYSFRVKRYKAAFDKLTEMGALPTDHICDVGAGNTEFGRFLYQSTRFEGRYHPVDAVLDGTDLEVWRPPIGADWYVLLEVIEHLKDPYRLLSYCWAAAYKGLVLTTPNPAVVDVLGMDKTHVTPVSEIDLVKWGLNVEPINLFGKGDDTLIAWKQVRR
jgi:hypothetical protein